MSTSPSDAETYVSEEAEQAESLVLDFVRSSAGVATFGDVRATSDTTFEERATWGDIRLEGGDLPPNGSHGNAPLLYIKVKPVSHSMLYGIDESERSHLPPGVPKSLSWRKHPFQSVAVDLARHTDNDTEFPFVNWIKEADKALNMRGILGEFTIRDARKFRPEGYEADYTVMRKFHTGSLSRFGRGGKLAIAARLSIDPYINGAVACFVDTREESINLHSSSGLLARMKYAIQTGRGLYYGAGRSSEDTIVVRHVDYGPFRIVSRQCREQEREWYSMKETINGGRPSTAIRLELGIASTPTEGGNSK